MLARLLQTTWLKLFGNSNYQTKMMFKERFKIRSTPCFLVFKGDEVREHKEGDKSALARERTSTSVMHGFPVLHRSSTRCCGICVLGSK